MKYIKPKNFYKLYFSFIKDPYVKIIIVYIDKYSKNISDIIWWYLCFENVIIYDKPCLRC